MYAKSLIASALALTLGMSALPSFAQNNDHQHNKWQRKEQRADRRDDRRDNRNMRREDRRDTRWDRHHYYNARGPAFRRGGYIPYEYRNRQYVVVDYRAHRLGPPLRGYHWVQVGSDYVMIAIATGIIASIVLNH